MKPTARGRGVPRHLASFRVDVTSVVNRAEGALSVR
jgi:hypothetical protein